MSVYLTPILQATLGLPVKITGLGNFNIGVLWLEFAESASEIGNTSVIPSYDGVHTGLLDGFSATILAGNEWTPISTSINRNLEITDQETNRTSTIKNTVSPPYTYNLNFFNYDNAQYFQASYRALPLYANVILVVGKFADNVYTCGFLRIECDENNIPEYISEYERPTAVKFGKITIGIDTSVGYVPIEIFGFGTSAGYQKCAEPIVKQLGLWSDDPYTEGGVNAPSGGGGGFIRNNDDIGIPPLPSLSAVDAGLITIFNPSLSQLQALGNYMWSSLFDIDTLKKLFADPMDCIIGLSIVPVQVPNGGIQPLNVGNVSTGIQLTKAAAQFVEVDCGEITVNKYYDGYLDYSPYTKIDIYLPYIGIHPLDVDDVMGKVIKVVYHVDILTGACIAYIKCGGSVLYSFIGQCSTQIPINAQNYSNAISGVISIAGSIGAMVATGGAAAPMVAGAAGTAANTFKPSIEKSGSLSGTAGLMGIQKPYLIITTPRQALPEAQSMFTGYPAFITYKLDKLKGSGYTEIEKIHLENLPFTDSEIEELENILKTGVIL